MMEETAAHLLCLLQRSELSDSEISQCATLASSLESKWDFFFTLAERNSAYILTSKRLDVLNLANEAPGLKNAFRAKAESFENSANDRSIHISKILRRADAANLAIILLKGALLGPALYKLPSYKKMNDVDVLLSFEDAKKFAEILKEEGFVSVGNIFGDDEFSKDNYHCPPFVSSDLKCVVGIHWGLNSPHSRWKIDLESIWKNKVEIVAYNSKCFRMSWEENLLHLCTHLPFFKIGCRELADVYNLAVCPETKINWADFGAIVKKWCAEDAAYRVLSLANALNPLLLPNSFLQDFENRSSRFTKMDTQKRVKLSHLLIATRSTHIAKIEKSFALFRLSNHYSEKVACWTMTWKLCFWPKRKDLPDLLGLLSLRAGFIALLTARLQAATYSWRAMARDLGNFALTYITLQNIGIVAKETLMFPFKKQSSPIRSHPTFKLMEMLE